MKAIYGQFRRRTRLTCSGAFWQQWARVAYWHAASPFTLFLSLICILKVKKCIKVGDTSFFVFYLSNSGDAHFTQNNDVRKCYCLLFMRLKPVSLHVHSNELDFYSHFVFHFCVYCFLSPYWSLRIVTPQTEEVCTNHFFFPFTVKWNSEIVSSYLFRASGNGEYSETSYRVTILLYS